MGIFTPGEQRNTEYLKLKYSPSTPTLTGEIVNLKNVFTRNLATKITSSVNWLPFIPTFPQLVCLFKTLVNQMTINLAIYRVLGLFNENLCTAVTLYITAIWLFPKGDRYIQV